MVYKSKCVCVGLKIKEIGEYTQVKTSWSVPWWVIIIMVIGFYPFVFGGIIAVLVYDLYARPFQKEILARVRKQPPPRSIKRLNTPMEKVVFGSALILVAFLVIVFLRIFPAENMSKGFSITTVIVLILLLFATVTIGPVYIISGIIDFFKNKYGKKEIRQKSKKTIWYGTDHSMLRGMKDLSGLNDYLRQRSLRGDAIIVVISGIITVLLGYSAVKICIFNLFMLLIGPLMILGGLAQILKPKRKVVLFMAIIMIVLSIWNIMVKIVSSFMGEWIEGFDILFDGFQIIIGIHLLKSQSLYSSDTINKPDSQILERIDILVKSIARSKAKTSKDIITYRTNTPYVFLADSRKWNVKVIGEYLICVGVADLPFIMKEIIVTHIKDFNFTIKRDSIFGNKHIVKIQIMNMVYHGRISHEYFERYEYWKKKGITEKFIKVKETLEDGSEHEMKLDKEKDEDDWVEDEEFDEDDSFLDEEFDELDSLIDKEFDELDSLLDEESGEDDSLLDEEFDEDDSLLDEESGEDDSLLDEEFDEDDSLLDEESDEDDWT